MKIQPYNAGDGDTSALFEESAMPHLDAAYNLARWLVKNEHDAEDVVQEAFLRAFKFYGSFRGGNFRTWLLTIVRHTCYTWLKENRLPANVLPFDETVHGDVTAPSNQELEMMKTADVKMVREAVQDLPLEFREILILREMEGLSYKEIADLANVPLGTVMSRLARARKWLQDRLTNRLKKKEA
jgi:RNA polymerase sigma-70 factor (ECF subfamily)